MASHRIAVIPGDGIGVEVIEATLRVLAALAARAPGLALACDTLPWGSDFYRRTGRMMPADGLATLGGYDAILFGAVGARDVPDHVTLWDLRLAICQGFDQYLNLRPARVLRGVVSPLRGVDGSRLDWLVVRENTEGEYAGAGGRVHRGMAGEVAVEAAVFTRAGSARVIRQAFARARQRRKRLTLVTKSNAQRFGMVLWDEVFQQIAPQFPDVAVDRELVDAMTVRMVRRPETLDVIVASNLHADILSDLAGALMGSLGLAASANINPERVHPSMFEPVHGAAFDIQGRGIANPLGAVWSAQMMLAHLGEDPAAAALMAAIERVAGDSALHTPDLGGSATTAQVTDALLAALG